jgi:hypothetical protein
VQLRFLAAKFQIRCSRKQHETQCLEFATLEWPNYRLWAGNPLKSNLNFLKQLDNGKAFGRLPNGFKKLFLAEKTLASEYMTENLVS